MNETPTAPPPAAGFRQVAEAIVRDNAARMPEDLAALTPEQIGATLHDLRVHQIELEMQNEELRRTQAELAAARARYFDLYDLAPVGYLTVNDAGVVMEGNLTATTLLGVTRSDVVGRPFSHFIHEADRDGFHLLRRACLAAEEARSCEVRLVRRDGTLCWVHLAATVAPDADGGPVLRVAFNDIHSAKTSELVLAARARLLFSSQDFTLNELLRATLDEAEALTGSLIGFYHFLRDDQQTLELQAWSTNTERHMCRAEGAGKHYPVGEAGVWADCVREDGVVVHNDYAALSHRKGLPHGHAAVVRELTVPVRRGGRIVAILGVGNKATDYHDGDIRTITSLADLAWDIVERMRMADALRANRDYLRAVLDSTTEAVFVEEPATGRILDVNRRMCEIYGYTYEEALAASIGDLSAGAPPYSQADALPWLEKARDEGPQTLEWIAKRKSGELFQAEINIRRATFGTDERLVVTVRDITARRQAEDVRNFLARTSSGTTDEPFFNVLARYLGQSLGMDFVCIDHLEGDGLNARTVAVWSDGKFEDNVTYALKDTPCGVLAGQVVCCFPAGVCQSFPHDEVLRDLQAESYAGVTLWSHTCQPIGLIAVISRQPLANREVVEATLKLVAERTAGELERLRIEEALKEAEWKFQALFENGPIGVAYHEMIHDAAGDPVDYRFIDVNRSFMELTGVDPRGQTATQAFPGIEDDPFDWIGTYGRVARGDESVHFEQYLQSIGRWYECVAYPYKPDHFVVAFLEITQRKRAEELLRASLGEKESLLKEIHHRVKNNLQIISSLLHLQSNRIDHPMVKAVLLDMQNRVRSMALIHEHLYRSENLAAVDLAPYLRHLCQQLFRALLATPGTIQLHLNLAPVNLPIDQAIPCGLLVNELVSNALKHAFPDGRGGEVRVDLQPLADEPGWFLRVADNGVGMPPGLVPDQLATMGLRLVADLAGQLGGRLEIGAGPGVVFEVICPQGGGG